MFNDIPTVTIGTAVLVSFFVRRFSSSCCFSSVGDSVVVVDSVVVGFLLFSSLSSEL